MLLGPQKECSLQESCPHLRSQFILCKRGAERVTKGWGDVGRRFSQRPSGLALGLHLRICKMGREKQGLGQKEMDTRKEGAGEGRETGNRDGDRDTQSLRTKSKPLRDRPVEGQNGRC